MDIRTIVADLYTNAAHSVYGLPATTESFDENATLDAERKIKERATRVTISIKENKFWVAKPDAEHKQHGFVLGFEDKFTTVATLSRGFGRICVSPDYSGCLFSVYEHNGTYKCCHTARGLGDKDVHVHALREYAANQHWDLVHEVPTINDNLNGANGIEVNGCKATLVVTRISYNINPPVVRTVRLRMNSQYLSIHRVRWTTPVGGTPVVD